MANSYLLKTLNWIYLHYTVMPSEFHNTSKYPLCGYILGVLTHTTAWERLWGGDAFLTLYICSSASPRIAALGLDCLNCEHCRMLVSFALPCPAQQWHQCDSECIFVTLEIHLTTLFSEIFCFSDFFLWRDRTGRDVTDKQTNGHRDRQTFLGKYYFRFLSISKQ